MDLQIAHLGSFYLAIHSHTLQPYSLAVAQAVKLHVDDLLMRADLRASGAYDRRRLGLLVGPGRAQRCALR